MFVLTSTLVMYALILSRCFSQKCWTVSRMGYGSNTDMRCKEKENWHNQSTVKIISKLMRRLLGKNLFFVVVVSIRQKTKLIERKAFARTIKANLQLGTAYFYVPAGKKICSHFVWPSPAPPGPPPTSTGTPRCLPPLLRRRQSTRAPPGCCCCCSSSLGWGGCWRRRWRRRRMAALGRRWGEGEGRGGRGGEVGRGQGLGRRRGGGQGRGAGRRGGWAGGRSCTVGPWRQGKEQTEVLATKTITKAAAATSGTTAATLKTSHPSEKKSTFLKNVMAARTVLRTAPLLPREN